MIQNDKKRKEMAKPSNLPVIDKKKVLGYKPPDNRPDFIQENQEFVNVIRTPAIGMQQIDT